jgi:HD-like signal output (HDOD) protein
MKTMVEWVAELKSWEMPVLQRSVRELGKLAGRAEQITAGEIADVVLRDPLMTLKVLRLVNGMSRSRLSNEITTVEHAAIMLGIVPFFNHLANLKAVEESLLKVDGALPGLMQAMSRAHHAAWQARDWAIFRADMKSEEVYVGALLYDVGEILLWAYAPEQALKIRKLARRNKTSLAQAQKEILGFDSRELQFALAEEWRLPEQMQAFMHCENSVQPRMLGVTLAASVARLTQTGWHDPELLADYEAIAEMLHMHLDEVVHMVHRNAVVEACHWDWYGVPPAAALLPMLPGDWPEEPGEVEKTPQPEEEPEVCMMPQPVYLRQAMEEISAHLDGSLNLHDMLSLVLNGMHQGLALDRVVFALMTADRSVIKAKYVMGALPDSPLRQFQFSPTSAELFGRLMGKAQAVWFNEGNRKTLEPLITETTWQMIGHGEFFAMSVMEHGRPVGLFYADRKHGSCALDEHSYQEFKKLCLRAAEGLAHLAKKK